MAIAYNTSIVRSGLVLHLDAANKKSYPGSGTVWNDLASNGNTATLTNGPTYSSGNNGYFSFDGVNDYALYSNNTLANNLSTMTVSAWIYADFNNLSEASPFVTKIPDSGSGTGWEMGGTFQNVKGCYFYVQGNSQYNLYKTTATPSAGTYWMEFAASYSGFNAAINLYLNGSKVAATKYGNASTISSISNTSSVALGTRNGTNTYGTNFATCSISNVKIYDRLLSDAEISQNFEALRGRYGI